MTADGKYVDRYSIAASDHCHSPSVNMLTNYLVFLPSGSCVDTGDNRDVLGSCDKPKEVWVGGSWGVDCKSIEDILLMLC